MIDIVERLRAHYDICQSDTVLEAAAEIERLREDLTTETNMRKDQDRRLEKAEAEIERLRAERDAQYAENVNRIAAEGAAILRAEAAKAEIERLRALLGQEQSL